PPYTTPFLSLQGDAPLALPHVDPHRSLETVREAAGQIHDVRIVGAAAHRAGGLLLTAASHETFHGADAQSLLDDPLGELLHQTRFVEGEQRAGVAGTQRTAREPALHERRQTQQAQRVGDLGARAADTVPELVLGAAEVI